MVVDKIHMISQCLQLHVPAPGTCESSYPKTLKPETITANIVASEWSQTCIANIKLITLESGAWSSVQCSSSHQASRQNAPTLSKIIHL
jgi:hypothetical protein